MYVDESLARGLRASFWAYLEAENASLLERIRTTATAYAGDLSNKKTAARFFKSMDAAARSPVVLHTETSGKRNNAVWWSIYLQSDPDHEYDSWNERALRFEVDRVWASGQVWHPTWLTTIIGEHCVARLFQRLPWTKTPTPRDVFPELRELALLLPWYNNANKQTAACHGGKRLSVFIPTTHGAFLGASNPIDHELNELRTFIGRHQFTQEQELLWQQLREIHQEPEIRTYLYALMDPTHAARQQTVAIWHETLIRIMWRLINSAHILQGDVTPLTPEEIQATVERREVISAVLGRISQTTGEAQES